MTQPFLPIFMAFVNLGRRNHSRKFMVNFKNTSLRYPRRICRKYPRWNFRRNPIRIPRKIAGETFWESLLGIHLEMPDGFLLEFSARIPLQISQEFAPIFFQGILERFFWKFLSNSFDKSYRDSFRNAGISPGILAGTCPAFPYGISTVIALRSPPRIPEEIAREIPARRLRGEFP